MNQSQLPPQVPIQRTRRNILAMAALVTTAIGANLAIPKSVRAANGNSNGNGNGNGNGMATVMATATIRVAPAFCAAQ